MTCFFRHKWERWDLARDATVKGGKPVLVQSRRCTRCGYRQIESFLINAPGASVGLEPKASADAQS